MPGEDLSKRIHEIEIRTRKLVDSEFAGEYHSIFKGRGMDFEEVRQYQVGDDIRTIDWNVTARAGTPYVKQFVEERDLTVMLLVDVSPSLLFGSVRRYKLELAAEISAVLALAANANNDKVGLLLFSDRVEKLVPPRKGRKHALRLVREALAARPAGQGSDIAVALRMADQILKRRSIIFLLSDFLMDPATYQSVLGKANLRHEVIAIRLADPLEEELPEIGLLVLQDPESGESMWIDTADPMWRAGFAQRVQAARLAREAVFRKTKVDFLSLRTDEDYMETLVSFFRSRARRLPH
ncbi:MAG: DUF58 domain-containing protein [Caldilineae bacterium]|nr:MAG: DUF58 domain-containing protein [Caldilineae bacterium]